jgi:hypothetical protein
MADMDRATTVDMHQLIMPDMHRTMVTGTGIGECIARRMPTMVGHAIMVVGTAAGVTTGKVTRTTI